VERKKKMKDLLQIKDVKEERFISKEKVEELLLQLCLKQDYLFRTTEIRNVLLVGRTRTGKTTAVRTLRGVENSAKPLTIFSETKNVNFRSFSLQGKNKLDYTFNIIDTPGLFENVKKGQEARSDDQIIDMIADCLKNEITRIHAIILFCSLTAGIDNTDVKAMEKLIECFGTDTNMSICVTRAESMTNKERIGIKKELLEHDKMGKLLEQVNENIFFIGAVDPEKMVDEETLKKYVDQVMEDRMVFLNFLFMCDEPIKIEDLKFVRDKKEGLKIKLKEKLQLAKDLLLREIKEDLVLIFEKLKFEMETMKQIVSLFDSESLSIYADIMKEMDKLEDKVTVAKGKLDG